MMKKAMMDTGKMTSTKMALGKSLKRCFTVIKTGTPISTSIGGQANELPAYPGLQIQGLGLLPLPITSVYAKS